MGSLGSPSLGSNGSYAQKYTQYSPKYTLHFKGALLRGLRAFLGNSYMKRGQGPGISSGWGFWFGQGGTQGLRSAAISSQKLKHIHIHTYIDTYIHIYMYRYICIHTYTYIYIEVHICIEMFSYLSIYLSIYLSFCLMCQKLIYIYIYTYILYTANGLLYPSYFGIICYMI